MKIICLKLNLFTIFFNDYEHTILFIFTLYIVKCIKIAEYARFVYLKKIYFQLFQLTNKMFLIIRRNFLLKENNKKMFDPLTE